MKKERKEVLNQINELSKDMSKVEFTLDENYKILALEINPEIKETILITAGCHGNESAPVYAMQKFLKEKKFPKNKRIILVPCVNPIGFVLNLENTNKDININRDFKENPNSKEAKFLKEIVEKYKPEFVVNLHEDPDEIDFYIWVQGDREEESKKLISDLNISYFKNKDIHGDQVKDGVILNAQENCSFEGYLIKNSIPNFCTETPGEWGIKKRIKVNLDILNKIAAGL